ncbi:MAG: hypothetical protein NUW06_00335 [Candidatus Acetothermia bacterium]|jgi:hypothetical protein|nr:hypothetical protein [Candidatus Acetothermia bacterium]MDH7504961.1 hypothetical protein [Candidatus Acetothermia bacterium]
MILDKENEIPDPEKIAKILDAVADKIPALLRAIRDTVYSKEAGEHFGEAVGAFYRKLVEQGIPAEQALEMARGYMISLRDLVGQSMKHSEKE